MDGKVNITIPRFSGGSYFSVLKIRGVAPRMKIHRPDPSVNRGIKVFRKRERTWRHIG